MGKKQKKEPKSKIPRDLTDKEMLKGYVEEAAVEELSTARAEPIRPVKQRPAVVAEAEPPRRLTELPPALVDELGRELVKLKLDLFQEGITDYSIKLTRDGHRIILTAVEKS